MPILNISTIYVNIELLPLNQSETRPSGRKGRAYAERSATRPAPAMHVP